MGFNGVWPQGLFLFFGGEGANLAHENPLILSIEMKH